MKAKFRIVKRIRPDGSTRFICRHLDAAGKIAYSETIPDVRTVAQAAATVQRKLSDGATGDNPWAYEYCLNFWLPTSEYAARRARRGHPLSAGHLYNSRLSIKNHMAPALKGCRLQDLTPAIIEKRVAALAKSGLSLSTINKAVQSVTVPVRTFCRMHRITYPLQWVEKEPESPVERGTLTLDEIRLLVASKGKIGAQPKKAGQKSGPGAPDVSPGQYAALLLGALCGLRAGEVRGLMFDDVDEKKGLIHIRHNWIDGDGLKAPKWGSTRTVPAPDPVLAAIRECIDIATGPYVFYSLKHADAPGRYHTVRAGFDRAMPGLGINEGEQKARRLSFHSLRHSFITLSRSAGIPDWLLKRLSGHRTDRMLENYSHADNVLDFTAARDSMAKILEPGHAKARRKASS